MAKELPFVQLENISKWYGKSVILDKIILNIPYGEVFGIIGKSVSGKSTMLSIIIGFIKSNEGKVYFQSHDIYTNVTEVQEQFGFAAQEVSF
jgi:ABC-type multidrug transport system ATPase subunit